MVLALVVVGPGPCKGDDQYRHCADRGERHTDDQEGEVTEDEDGGEEEPEGNEDAGKHFPGGEAMFLLHDGFLSDALGAFPVVLLV